MTESPERKALNYVEGLGLNSVYEQVLEVRRVLGDKVLDLSSLRADRRALENAKDDTEMEVAEQERAKRSDLSATAFKEHIKSVYYNNSDIQSLRSQISDVTSQIEVLEHEINLLNSDIKIAVARLHELGGYFQFMAVIKQAQSLREAKEIDEKDPWK